MNRFHSRRNEMAVLAALSLAIRHCVSIKSVLEADDYTAAKSVDDFLKMDKLSIPDQIREVASRSAALLLDLEESLAVMDHIFNNEGFNSISDGSDLVDKAMDAFEQHRTWFLGIYPTGEGSVVEIFNPFFGTHFFKHSSTRVLAVDVREVFKSIIDKINNIPFFKEFHFWLDKENY